MVRWQLDSLLFAEDLSQVTILLRDSPEVHIVFFGCPRAHPSYHRMAAIPACWAPLEDSSSGLEDKRVMLGDPSTQYDEWITQMVHYY